MNCYCVAVVGLFILKTCKLRGKIINHMPKYTKQCSIIANKKLLILLYNIKIISSFSSIMIS